MDLAATLSRIASGGPDEFYRGHTADLLVAEMRRGGGIITHEDWPRTKLCGESPLPSSTGATR